MKKSKQDRENQMKSIDDYFEMALLAIVVGIIAIVILHSSRVEAEPNRICEAWVEYAATDVQNVIYRQAGCPNPNPEGTSHIAPDAVSYTHLTLPTIYSV